MAGQQGLHRSCHGSTCAARVATSSITASSSVARVPPLATTTVAGRGACVMQREPRAGALLPAAVPPRGRPPRETLLTLAAKPPRGARLVQPARHGHTPPLTLLAPRAQMAHFGPCTYAALCAAEATRMPCPVAALCAARLHGRRVSHRAHAQPRSRVLGERQPLGRLTRHTLAILVL